MDTAILNDYPIDRVPFFEKMPKDDWGVIDKHLSICCYEAGEQIFGEGEPNPGHLYVVLEGEVALCNQGEDLITHAKTNLQTYVKGKNEIIGAVSFLDGDPYPSSAIAKPPVTLAVLDFPRGDLPFASCRLRTAVVSELKRELTSDARSSIASRVGSLQNEADFSRYKHAVGRIVVTTLSLLSFYTLLLSVLPQFQLALTVNFAISPFIIAMFAAIMGPVIWYSGFPIAFFGLQASNWRRSLEFSVVASLGFLAVAAGLKLLLIHTTETFSSLSLFGVADVQQNMQQVVTSPLYWVAVGLYLVLTPLQEFVARCCLQAPLFAFLNGSTFSRHLSSILVSNLVFAAAHSHISFAFAMAAFIPGLFWGWVFARTNSLIAAAASHFMIGGAGIFLFGIEEVVKKLT